MAKSKDKPKKSKELSTSEQFEKQIYDLEEFQDRFLIALAGTDRFEIVPTQTENRTPLSKEQYSLLKNECSRLGLKILYQIQNTDGTIMYINSENGKIGYMHDGMH